MALRSVLYQGNFFDIAYEYVPNGAAENAVFLHGWGSEKSVMRRSFGHYFGAYNHYYLDLPGFGKSPNAVFLTPHDYAQIVDAFFASLRVPITLAVGHSFGGKIATLCASTRLILLSSAGILAPKSFAVRCRLAAAKIAKKCHIPAPFLRAADAKNLPAVMYAIFKYTVQENFAPYFAQCPKKTCIFWGTADTTTPLKMGETIAKLIPGAHFVPCAGGHFFFLNLGSEIAHTSAVFFAQNAPK